MLTCARSKGTLCDRDGELFIKPCTQAEIAFYQTVNEAHPEFAELMPLFMGTLMLSDAAGVAAIQEQLPAGAEHIPPQVQEQVVQLATAQAAALATNSQQSQSQTQTQPWQQPQQHQPPLQQQPEPPKDNVKWVPNGNKKIKTDTALVLENAAFGYRRPNIMDVKLGVRLWADDAPLEKKRRYDQVSAETTHGALGFRIAGMRVFRGSGDEAELDAEGYRIYGADYGRVDVNAANVADAFRRYIFNTAAGVDEELGQAVAHAFRRDLERVRDVLERAESRMYSASLLFVFEGDGAALREAVLDSNAAVERQDQAAAAAAAAEVEVLALAAAAAAANKAGGAAGARANLRVDSGIDLGEDGEMIIPPGVSIVGLDELESASPSAEGDFSEEEGTEETSSLPHVYTLKLIDFAHARFTPGLGPDENLLTGVRSLIRIFDELSR